MKRPVFLLLFFALLPATVLRADNGTLGTGQYRLIGASFDVSPVEQNVPVGVAATVKTLFEGSATALASTGARVAAELTGPSVPSPVTISAAPGEDLVVPPLSVKGEHLLQNIRLTTGGGVAVAADHPTARIVVSDILVTRITSRALTSQELAARGVVVNDSSYKAYSFALALAIQGRTIRIEVPTVVETSAGYQPIGPPLVDVENRDERFVPPTVIAVPMREDAMPGGGPPDPQTLDEGEASPQPVFGLLVFPGNIRFLNQFFSVILMVQNGAAEGSPLALSDVSTTISLPAASLRLSKTIPSVPDGAPVPVRGAGADEALGTADDVAILVAQATGQAEFVTEGLRVGTHDVTCELSATLQGLANQPARTLRGRARGSVLVRDPTFGLTFNHPDVVRDGEEYELRVSVANTSTVRANDVTIAIDAASLTGAEAVGVPAGTGPAAPLGDIPPGESRLAKFALKAKRTGRVVASAFTSDGPVVGSLRLRTGVTNDGIPLSPDSFIFPRVISVLPPEVVDPATSLIGIAHGLATMDPTAPGVGCGLLGEECAPPFADGVVRDRVFDLVTAARRASLGEPVAAAVADLAFTWLGSAVPSPGFDGVRRSNSHGRDFEAGIGAVLSAHAQEAGIAGLERTLLDAAVANRAPTSPLGGPIWALLEEGGSADPAGRLYVGDPVAGSLSGLRPGEPRYVRETAYASLHSIGGPVGGELAIAARPPDSGVVFGIEGKRAGTVALTVFLPDGSGDFRRARIAGIVTAPGSVTNVHVAPGATWIQAVSATDVLRNADAVAVEPSPFGPYAAIQDLSANPLGKAVSLVFNRPIREAEAAQVQRWALPAPRSDGGTYERTVGGAFPQAADPRHLTLVSETVISPFRPGEAVGTGIPAQDGSVWSGAVPITPRLVQPGGTVAGRVIGPDGTPLPNAPVRLSESATDDLTGEVFAATTSVTRTDATGAFYFDYVRKQDGRPFRVDSFDAITGSKGYAVGSVRTQGQTVQVDVVLQGRGTVKGTVVDGTGAALGGVIVRCASENDPGFRTAQLSRSDGGFTFTSVPVGAVRLQAEDPRTNRTAYATVGLSAPGGVAERQLVIAQLPRTSLRGVVRHGRDGSPYEGVHVAGYGQLGEYFGVRQTGSAGSFSFESAPAGNVRLEVFDVFVSSAPVLTQTVTLVADQPAEVTLTVEEAPPRFGAVAGTVRKVVGGAPVPAPGVVVFVQSTGHRTTTVADGTYRIEDVPIGAQTVTALDPATGRSVSGSATIQHELTSPLDLQFADGTLGRVVGTVVDQQGRPKGGVVVEIVDEGPPVTVPFRAATAADGSFTLLNVPPGTYRVQATFGETRGGRTLRNAGAATVTVPGPGAAGQTAIQLRGWVTVSGRVVARVRDRNGELHDNAVFAPVELHSARFSDGTSNPDPEAGPIYRDGPSLYATVNTDPETGEFRFEDVRGGPIKVVAKNPFYGDRAYAFGFVQGDATRGPVDVVFDGNLGIVDGYLFNADGSPIVGGHLTLTGAGPFDVIEATTRPAGPANGAGYFVFPLVPFSPRIHVRYSEELGGVPRFAEANVSLSAQAPTARVTLRALGVGSVTVRVVQPAGDDLVPVAGAQVRVDELEGERRSTTRTTDSGGIASFSDVTEGRIAVLARSGLLGGRASVFGSGEGFSIDAVVKLTGTAQVSGVVRSPADGSPVANVNVLLVSLGGGGLGIGPLAAMTTAPDGSFAFDGIPAVPGALYRADAEDSGTLRRGHSATLALAPGDAKLADVTLNALGAVTGRLTTFDGATALAGAEITVFSFEAIPGSEHARETRFLATTDAAGVYSVDGVPAGSISVRAHDDLTGLSAFGSGTLVTEGQVVRIDLRATPTGTVQGLVRRADGTPLDETAAVPTVSISSHGLSRIVTARSYEFAGIPSTHEFVLAAREPASPFHEATARGAVGAGQTQSVDLRYGPIGSVRVHLRKPDPTAPGSFVPAVGLVTIYQGGPYALRFPSNSSFRTDAQGDLTIVEVGGGFGLRVSGVEDGMGAAGSSTVPDLSLDGQQAEVTIVVEPRGLVRGRVLLPDGASPAAGAPVRLYLSAYNVSPLSPPASTVAAVTGPDGRFELRDVPLRQFFVIAETSEPVARLFVSGGLSAAAPVGDLGDLVLDGSRPTLVSVDPVDGTTGVGLMPSIRFSFSEPLWPYGDDALWRIVQISSPAGPISTGFRASLDATRQVLTVEPTSTLAGATLHEVRVPASLRDRSLLDVGVDTFVRFTTADLTNPAVVSSSPVAGQIQVPVLVNPAVVLSKAIDPATVVAGTHLRRVDAAGASVAIAPTLKADGRTIALNPAANLEPEAEYEVVLDQVKDTAGNPLLATARIPFFTRDDIAPAVSFDPPDTSEPVEGTTHDYTVRFADDDVKTLRLHLVAATGEIWNATNGVVTPAREARSFTWPVALPRVAVAGGPAIRCRVVAIDFGGNASAPVDLPLTLLVDSPPAVVSAEPTAGTVKVGGTFSVTVSATDDLSLVAIDATPSVGIEQVSTQVTSSSPTSRTELRAYRVRLDAAPGAASVSFVARDSRGQRSPATTVSVTVQPDDAPVVSILSPASGTSVLSGSNLPVTYSATDDLGVVALVVRLGESAVNVPSPAATGTVNVRAPVVTTAGTHELTVTATDSTGHAVSATVPVTVRPDEPPSVAIGAPPAGSTFVSGTTVPVTYTVSDDVGVVTLELGLGTAQATISNPSGTGTATLVAPVVGAAQSLPLSARATDASGHVVETSVPVTVKPDESPRVAILSPASGANVLSGSTVPVSYSVSDDVSVASLVLQLGSSSVTLVRPPAVGTTSLTAPAVTVVEPIVLSATATDSAGHVTRTSVTLSARPDDPPTFSLAAPTDGLRVKSGASLLVSGSLADDNGRATLTASLGSATRTVASVGPFSFTLPVPVVAAPTPVTLALRAQDFTGHTATPVDVALVVEPDTVSPSVVVSSPAPGSSVVGGKAFSLVATASDDVAVTAFRYRVGQGAFVPVAGRVISVQVPTGAVSAPTAMTVEVEAEDGAGHRTSSTVGLTVVPNQPPTLSLSRPATGTRITAGATFVVEGTSADDTGVPTTTVTFDGQSRSATSNGFSVTFTAPSVSVETTFTLSATARDPEGNESPAVSRSLTVVPDVGGTPTVQLTAPAPGVLLVGETSAISITFADNVGLSFGSAEVTGPFTSGPRTWALSGTSSVQSVAIAPADRPFGERARVVAKNVDLGGRVATLDVSIPVAYHRLELPLPSGALVEGSSLAAVFRVGAAGRQRASALRLEIGTVSGPTFSVLSCVQKAAPLSELETLAVRVPVGRTGLHVRSVLVETTGGLALAASADATAVFLDPLATSGDTAAPTVVILNPADGLSVLSGDLVHTSVTAADDTGVERIDVSFGGITKTCTAATCELAFFAPVVATAGTQTLAATARDGAGKSTTTSVTVSVSPRSSGSMAPPVTGELVVGDGRAPTVRFLTPYVSPYPVAPDAPFRPAVEAEDSDGIDRVEVFLGEDDVPCLVLRPDSPNRDTCLVPDANAGVRLRLRAVAFDRSGDRSEVETELVVAPGVRLLDDGPLPAGLDLTDATVYVESETLLDRPLEASTIVVRDGGRILPVSEAPVVLRASRDLFLDTGGVVSASGAGPAPSRNEPPFDTPAGEGGAHGGDAGSRLAFGSIVRPDLPGAPGGDSPDRRSRGSRAGGVVSVRADRVVLAGRVEADGEPQLPGGLGGIGAGGSIRVEAAIGIFAPRSEVDPEAGGLLSAAGGPVADRTATASLGAGGRIALEAPVVEPVAVDVVGSEGRESVGSAGTVFVRDGAHPNGRLLIRGGLASGKDAVTDARRVLPTHVSAAECDPVRKPGDERPVSGSPVHRECGVVVLDGLSVEGGARAVFRDRLEVPRELIFVDAHSSLEQP